MDITWMLDSLNYFESFCWDVRLKPAVYWISICVNSTYFVLSTLYSKSHLRIKTPRDRLLLTGHCHLVSLPNLPFCMHTPSSPPVPHSQVSLSLTSLRPTAQTPDLTPTPPKIPSHRSQLYLHLKQYTFTVICTYLNLVLSQIYLVSICLPVLSVPSWSRDSVTSLPPRHLQPTSRTPLYYSAFHVFWD